MTNCSDSRTKGLARGDWIGGSIPHACGAKQAVRGGKNWQPECNQARIPANPERTLLRWFTAVGRVLSSRTESSPWQTAFISQVGHIAAEFESLANVLLGRGCGNPAVE